MRGARAFVLIAAALSLLTPALGRAQAWVPPKGEGLFTLSLQSLDGGDHLFNGPVVAGVDLGETAVDLGDVEARTLSLQGDFGLTDRLALFAGITYLESRYLEGGRVHELPPGHRDLPGDDGAWHGSFQDASIGLRYMITKGPWALTPLVAVAFPLRSYSTIGHTAVGRGLNELQLGGSVGRIFSGSKLLSGYFQADYRYALVENVQDHSVDRSNLELELGWFVTPRWTVRGFASFQETHDGIDWNHIGGAHEFHAHDRAADADWTRVGVGLSVPVSQTASLFVSYARTVDGVNTHDGSAITIGTSVGFQAPGFGGTRIRTAD